MKHQTVPRRLALCALTASAAVLLGYVEFLVPVVPPIAGIKLGLGNLAVLLALRRMGGLRAAAAVMAVKIVVCAALFAGMGPLPYSLAGGGAALAVMTAVQRFSDRTRLSAAGVSAAGGAAHMAAQTATAVLVTGSPAVWRLLPPLLAVGTLTGLVNGCLVNGIERRAGRYFTENQKK